MTTLAVTTSDTIATTTQSIIAEMKQRYASAEASNTVPSMLELVALGVQMVDQRPQTPPLTGIQKMEIVKQVVAGIIDILPISESAKTQLQAGLFLVENVAEVALSLLKANEMLATEVETVIKGCMPSWCCADSSTRVPVTTTKALNIPFPLIK